MKTYTFSFATLVIHEENLAEIIIREGIKMNVDLVDELHNFLLSSLKNPFSLLINRINSFSYSFEAQGYMDTIPQIRAIAVVAYGQKSIQTA